MKKKIGLFQSMRRSDDEVFGRKRPETPTKFMLETRPYFHPLPENWEKHKHLNVVPYEDFINGQSFTQQEVAVVNIIAKLEKTGYFTITPQKHKEKPSGTFNFPLSNPKEKSFTQLDDEDDE